MPELNKSEPMEVDQKADSNSPQLKKANVWIEQIEDAKIERATPSASDFYKQLKMIKEFK